MIVLTLLSLYREIKHSYSYSFMNLLQYHNVNKLAAATQPSKTKKNKNKFISEQKKIVT